MEWFDPKVQLPEENQLVVFIIDKSVDHYGGSVCAGRARWFHYHDHKVMEFGTWGLGFTQHSIIRWAPLYPPEEFIRKMGEKG